MIREGATALADLAALQSELPGLEIAATTLLRVTTVAADSVQFLIMQSKKQKQDIIPIYEKTSALTQAVEAMKPEDKELPEIVTTTVEYYDGSKESPQCTQLQASAEGRALKIGAIVLIVPCDDVMMRRG